MFAALRIGYAELPAQLIPQFQRAKQATGRANGTSEQLALAAFLLSGAFARHLRRARLVYGARRDTVVAALTEASGLAWGHVTGTQTGFHLVWWPPPGFDVERFQGLAESAGLQLPPISGSSKRTDLPVGFMIGYTGMDDVALRGHASTLLRVVEIALRP